MVIVKREGQLLVKSEDKKPRLGDLPAFEHESTKLPWEQTGEAAPEERMASKLVAVRCGLSYAKRILGLVDAFPEKELPVEVANVRSQLANVVSDEENREVLVGVCGASGAGKSSLINALLGEQGLLPEGHQEATTAAACAVSYNRYPDSQRPYRGIVSLHSRDDVVADLGVLLGAVRGRLRLSSPQPGDPAAAMSKAEMDDSLTEYEDQIHLGMDRFAETLDLARDDLEAEVAEGGDAALSALAERLLRRRVAVSSFIERGDIDMSFATASQLSDALRPYLTSQRATHGDDSPESFAAWPLVMSVRMLLPNTFLQDGIVIVDLPGRGDVNTARVAVSESYESRLDAILAVAPAVRAGSETTLSAILSGHQRARMETGGVLAGERVAVVVTKTDDLKLDAILPGSPGDLGSLRQSRVASQATAARLRTLHQGLTAVQAQARRSVMAMKDQRKNLVAAAPRGRDPVRTGLNRQIKQLGTKLSESDALCRQLKHRTARASVAAQVCAERIMHVQVQTRNSGLRRSIGGRAKAGAGPGGDVDPAAAAVKVMCTSSDAMWRAGTESPMAGFPRAGYSGIPALCGWITNAAAQRSEAHIDHALATLKICLKLIDSWCVASAGGASCAKEDQDVAEHLRIGHVEMSQELSQIMDSIKDRVASVKLPDSKEGIRREVEAAVTDAVRRWPLKSPVRDAPGDRMAFATHTAILRRGGGRYASRRNNAQYHWYGDMSDGMLDPFRCGWTRTVDEGIDECLVATRESIRRVWAAYETHLLGVANLLGSRPLRVSDPGTRTDVKSALFASVRADLERLRAQLYGLPQQQLRSSDGSVFLSKLCARTLDITGSGCFRLRLQALEADVPAGATSLFRNSVAAIESDVRAKAREFGAAVCESARQATTQVECELTLGGGDDSAATAELRTKVKRAIAECFQDWRLLGKGSNGVVFAGEELPCRIRPQDLGASHPAFVFEGENFYLDIAGETAPGSCMSRESDEVVAAQAASIMGTLTSLSGSAQARAPSED